MQLQKFFPIMQLLVILFVLCKAFAVKEKIYNLIDNRIFWGLAALYNLPDMFFAIVEYTGYKFREVDMPPDADWQAGIRILTFSILVLMDVLAINLISKKERRNRLLYPWLIDAIVVALVVVFELWIAPNYYIYKIYCLRFIAENMVPVIISIYLFYRKSVVHEEKNDI